MRSPPPGGGVLAWDPLNDARATDTRAAPPPPHPRHNSAVLSHSPDRKARFPGHVSRTLKEAPSERGRSRDAFAHRRPCAGQGCKGRGEGEYRFVMTSAAARAFVRRFERCPASFIPRLSGGAPPPHRALFRRDHG